MKNIEYISAGAGSGKTHKLTEILAENIATSSGRGAADDLYGGRRLRVP